MINRAMTQVRFKRRPGLKRYADDGTTLPPSPVFLWGQNSRIRAQAPTRRGNWWATLECIPRHVDPGVEVLSGWRQGSDVARPKPGHPLRLATPEGKFFETYQRKRFPKP